LAWFSLTRKCWHFPFPTELMQNLWGVGQGMLWEVQHVCWTWWQKSWLCRGQRISRESRTMDDRSYYSDPTTYLIPTTYTYIDIHIGTYVHRYTLRSFCLGESSCWHIFISFLLRLKRRNTETVDFHWQEINPGWHQPELYKHICTQTHQANAHSVDSGPNPNKRWLLYYIDRAESC